jgi:hypothetical protein
MMTQGCGDEGKSACSPSQKELAAYNLSQQIFEHRLCQSGNMLHCSPIELKLLDPEKVLPSVSIMNTGQGGYFAEAGVFIQKEATLDWVEGNLYLSTTTGHYGYLGTPTGLQGEVGFGLNFLHNIPISNKDIASILEGDQYDLGGQIGADVIAEANLNLNLSYDINSDGKRTYFPSTGYVFTEGAAVSFAFNGVPNGFEGGIQFGKSTTIVTRKISLW